MSAGFRLAGQVTRGANSAVELCLDSLAGAAAAQFGQEDALARFSGKSTACSSPAPWSISMRCSHRRQRPHDA